MDEHRKSVRSQSITNANNALIRLLWLDYYCVFVYFIASASIAGHRLHKAPHKNHHSLMYLFGPNPITNYSNVFTNFICECVLCAARWLHRICSGSSRSLSYKPALTNWKWQWLHVFHCHYSAYGDDILKTHWRMILLLSLPFGGVRVGRIWMFKWKFSTTSARWRNFFCQNTHCSALCGEPE